MRARQRWGLWKISRRIFGVISIRAGNVCIRWWNIIDSSNGFFMYFFLGVLVCFFLRQKKAEFKDETEKFYPNFLHLFVAIFFMLVLYIV